MNEEEMEKIAKEISKIPGAPKSIRLSVRYDQKLQEITGKETHPVFMGYGATFSYLLQNIFIEYPEIEKQYPPGTLGFTINDIPPKTYTPLFDGDIVALSVASSF